jgi:type IV pilus assembly protein PilC
MASFVATYTTPGGQERRLTVTAADIATARRRLRRRGIRATSVVTRAEAGSGPRGASSRWRSEIDVGRLLARRPNVKQRAVFASKLSALTNAGVPVVRSMDLLAGQQINPMFRRALRDVSLVINEGNSLADAFRRWPQVFDRLTIAMVEAGEAGGVLDETLARLARLLEEIARIRNQIRSALAYPVIVLVLAILVFLGMTIFVIPIFGDIYKSLGGELPVFTQIMLNVSELMRSGYVVLLIGLIIVLAAFLLAFYNTPKGKRFVDRLLLRLPLFGDLLQKAAMAQFCRIFSALSRAGVPILYSLEITAQTSGNAVVSDGILAARSLIQDGVLLSKALKDQGSVFPDLALGMMSIGEETGEMDAMLSKVADFYEDEFSTAVKSLTALLEPLMIVFVGGIVGAILVAMYLPMFAIFDQIR